MCDGNSTSAFAATEIEKTCGKYYLKLSGVRRTLRETWNFIQRLQREIFELKKKLKEKEAELTKDGREIIAELRDKLCRKDKELSCLIKNTSQTISDLRKEIYRLKVKLSNCAHWADPDIYVDAHNALWVIREEALGDGRSD